MGWYTLTCTRYGTGLQLGRKTETDQRDTLHLVLNAHVVFKALDMSVPPTPEFS